MPRFTKENTLKRLEQKKLKNPNKKVILKHTEQLALLSVNKSKEQEYARERLSALVANGGKSQVEIAILLGVSQSTFNGWLTGYSRITIPKILIMAIEVLEEKLGIIKNNPEN